MTTQFPHVLVPPHVLTVGGLTAYIQSLLEEDKELIQVWLTGEVSSANKHRSGLFFTLQDPDDQASIHCVAWPSYREKLVIQPEVGEQIVVLGRIRLYPQRGQYQLMVWQVLPAGEGLRSLRYRQLRDRLAAEGLFDSQSKRALPQYPQTLAVVTSPRAAAWGDIQRTLKFRHPGLKVLLSPSSVQGDQAPAAIVAAIQRVQQDQRADVLILARGGGATEDMTCFNDERVVRAIAQCPIPVVTGIGHQRDEFLADLAADVAAHTPTAAAELAIPRLADLQSGQQELIVRLYLLLNRKLDVAQEHLQVQKKRLHRLQLGHRLEREHTHLAHCRQRLRQTGDQHLLQSWAQHQLLQQKLAALNPTAVLHRGYAVVRTLDGTIVRSADGLNRGQELRIQLGKGAVNVQITNANVTPTHPQLEV